MNPIIESYIKQFKYYELLGKKTIDALSDQQLLSKTESESNSVANLVNHISGNMLSRWTDFMQADGEKEWRNRDREFEEVLESKYQLIEAWEKGWSCLYKAIEPLRDEDLTKSVYIRSKEHTVLEAINRQLAHYAYHIGQIVFIGKTKLNEDWKSLSIPKGNSKNYNAAQTAAGKRKEHFTDQFLKDEKK